MSHLICSAKVPADASNAGAFDLIKCDKSVLNVTVTFCQMYK